MATLSAAIVKHRVASMRDVEEALARQALYGGDLSTNLLEVSDVGEAELTHVLALSLGLEPAPEGELPRPTDSTLRLVPAELADRHGFYPLQERDGRLVVAVSDLLPPEVETDLGFALGVNVVQRAAPLVRVRQAISRDYGPPLALRLERLLAKLDGLLGRFTGPLGGEQASGAGVWPLPGAASVPPVTAEPMAPPNPPVGPAPDASPRLFASGPRAGLDPVEGHPAATSTPKQSPSARPKAHGPAVAEQDLAEASTRDEVLSAFFDFSAQHFDYCALFVVQSDVARGRDAHGPGREKSTIGEVRIPLEPTSSLGQVKESGRSGLIRLSGTGRDRELAHALRRPMGQMVFLLPLSVRDRCVLLLYGDRGIGDLVAADVAPVASLAPLVSAALERLILQRKTSAQRGPASEPPVSMPPDSVGAPRPAAVDAAAMALPVAEVEPARAPVLPTAAEAPPAMPHGTANPESTPAAPHAFESEWPSVDSEPARPADSAAPLRAPDTEPLCPVEPTPPSPPVQPEPPAPAKRPQASSASVTIHRMRTISSVPSQPSSTQPPPTERMGAPKIESLGATEQIVAPVTQRLEPPRALPDPPRHERGALEYRLLQPRSTPPASIPPPREGVSMAPVVPVGDTKRSGSVRPRAGASHPPAARGANSDAPLPLMRRSGSGGYAAVAGGGLVDAMESGARQRKTTPRGIAPVAATETSAPAPASRSRLELMVESSPPPAAEPAPEIAVGSMEMGEDWVVEDGPTSTDGKAPLAPATRYVQYGARAPRRSEPLRPETSLPSIIVDVKSDCVQLLDRLLGGDASVQSVLVEMGASAAEVLAARLPGPITAASSHAPGRSLVPSQSGPLLATLVRIGAPAVPFVAERASDPDPTVRLWATRILGELPWPESARAVAQRFTDEAETVRRAALGAGRMLMGDRTSRVALREALADICANVGQPVPDRNRAALALGDLREQAAIPDLIVLLDDENRDVAAAVQRALVALTAQDFGPSRARYSSWWVAHAGGHRIEWLIDALTSENGEVRHAAGEELKGLTKEYFGYYDDLPPRERAAAQQRYREWWNGRGKALFG